MAPSIILMVDVVSPFAYMAFHILNHSPVFKDVEKTYVPVFLGGIMKATGNQPPTSIINKREWMLKERMRWSNLFDIPMIKNVPQGFPWNTLQVQRALTATSLLKPELLPDLLAELYRLAWVESKNISNFEQARPVFVKMLGEATAQEIMEKAASDEVRKLLTQRTQEALYSGCFGLPWYIATNTKGEKDCFWGFDHIGQLTDFMGLERPSGTKQGGWRAML